MKNYLVASMVTVILLTFSSRATFAQSYNHLYGSQPSLSPVNTTPLVLGRTHNSGMTAAAPMPHSQVPMYQASPPNSVYMQPINVPPQQQPRQQNTWQPAVDWNNVSSNNNPYTVESRIYNNTPSNSYGQQRNSLMGGALPPYRREPNMVSFGHSNNAASYSNGNGGGYMRQNLTPQSYTPNSYHAKTPKGMNPQLAQVLSAGDERKAYKRHQSIIQSMQNRYNQGGTWLNRKMMGSSY